MKVPRNSWSTANHDLNSSKKINLIRGLFHDIFLGILCGIIFSFNLLKNPCGGLSPSKNQLFADAARHGFKPYGRSGTTGVICIHSTKAQMAGKKVEYGSVIRESSLSDSAGWLRTMQWVNLERRSIAYFLHAWSPLHKPVSILGFDIPRFCVTASENGAQLLHCLIRSLIRILRPAFTDAATGVI